MTPEIFVLMLGASFLLLMVPWLGLLILRAIYRFVSGADRQEAAMQELLDLLEERERHDYLHLEPGNGPEERDV